MDKSILDADVPFLSSAPLQADQHETFSTPEVSAERATIFEHCRRAVARGMTAGRCVDNPDRCGLGVLWVEMDGKRLPDGLVPLERGLVKHRILVRMGKQADSQPRGGAAGGE